MFCHLLFAKFKLVKEVTLCGGVIKRLEVGLFSVQQII